MTLIPILNQSPGSVKGRDKKWGSLSSYRRPCFREICPRSAPAFVIQNRRFGRYLTFSGMTHRWCDTHSPFPFFRPSRFDCRQPQFGANGRFSFL